MAKGKIANFWKEIKAHYRASLVVMLGIYTIISGLFAIAMVLVMGWLAGVLTEPGYWAAIIMAVLWALFGIGFTVWGWRSEPVEGSDPILASEPMENFHG